MSDLSLLDSEIESDLRASIRDLMTAKCAPAAVTGCYDGDRSIVAPLWAAVARELGLAGLLVPEELGGAGASVREAAVVLEELGRAVAPVPFLTSSVIATSVLLGPGRDADADELLSVLASGKRTAALALPLSTAALGNGAGVAVDSSGRLGGRISSVAGVLDADELLVPVSTPEGTAIYRVPVTEVDCVPVISLDMSRQLADVMLNRTVASLVIAPEHGAEAVDRALTIGAALLASEQVGVATWCLTTTVAYLKQRRQFGRPLGSFQALKHRLADVYVSIETANATAHYAAAAIAADDPDVAVATAVAQSWCGDVAVRAAEAAVQLHGGLGMTWEHPAHLYLKRAKADHIALGTSSYHRAQLADLVDLTAP